MAVQSGIRDSLPDLTDKVLLPLEDEGKDVVLAQYDDADQLMVSDIPQDSALADGHSEQFLTISHGDNQISVNDDGSIIYADQSLTSEPVLPEVHNAEETLASLDGNTFYMESNETPQTQENEDEVMEIENEDNFGGNMIFLKQADGTLTRVNTIQDGKPGNVVIRQSNTVRVKRPAPFITASSAGHKVFLQQGTSKGPVLKRAFVNAKTQSPTKIALSPSRFRLLQQPVTGNKVFIKKVSTPGGSGTTYLKPNNLVLSRPGTVVKPVRTVPGSSQLKTIITPGGNARTVTLGRTISGLAVSGRVPPKVILRPGVVSSPRSATAIQIGGKQQLVRLASGNIAVQGKPRVITMSKPMPTIGGRPVTFIDSKKTALSGLKHNATLTAAKTTKFAQSLKEEKNIEIDLVVKEEQEEPGIISKREGGIAGVDDEMERDDVDEMLEPDRTGSGDRRLLEANGIRPKKPCNCTRSQCLKLYCECFANGEFCFECNCNNCANNLEHEEERQQAIKGCLDRNPDAFRRKPQIGVSVAPSDSDDEERRVNSNRGCHCKKTQCLKNYCECFEGKLTCIKTCKCTGCKNTEEDMAAWMRGETFDSQEDARDSVKQSSPFMPKALAEALCHCILVKADEADRAGEDPVTTERRIIEELGQRLVQIIGNRSKKST